MATKRPNIILFTTDQHRGDHVGLSGHPAIETPNLDGWINRGAYFPNAYSEIPSTTGARRMLHSGKGPWDCGFIGYGGAEFLEPNLLAAVLADAGYHCINVGWRNMHPTRKLYGFHTVIPHDLRPGADDYMEWLQRKAGPDARERGHGSDANGWLARPWHLDENLHPTVWTNNVTIEQIVKRDPTRPYFVWCSHMRPHSPYDPPQHYWDMYIDRELPPVAVGDWAGMNDVPVDHLDRTAWRGRLSEERLRRMRAGYRGLVTHIDFDMGRLMEELIRIGQSPDDALMLFTADHGDMQGDHHLYRKCYAWEGSARIPFVVRYPSDWDLPTGEFAQPVGLQDVMPTLLDAAGVDIPEGVTGRSVLDAARGEPWRECIHGEHSPCYGMEQAMQYLTDGKEKYVWLPYTDTEFLFDLEVDRGELCNLAADPENEDRVAPWRRRLVELLGERGDGFSDGERLIPRTERWSAVVPGHPSNG